MKKMWIKKDNIYYKPFYKQKLKMTMLAVILLGFVFFAYQIIYMNQLSATGLMGSTLMSASRNVLAQKRPIGEIHGHVIESGRKLVRGIRLRDFDSYKPNKNGTFKCIETSVEIDYGKVNDDYCDCADASDEPGTSACPKGLFYCKYQLRHRTGRGRDISIPSSRVNDRICDCCDGSDENETAGCLNSCV